MNHMEMPNTIMGKASMRPPVNNICPNNCGRISGCLAMPSIYLEQINPHPKAEPKPAAARIIPTPMAV